MWSFSNVELKNLLASRDSPRAYTLCNINQVDNGVVSACGEISASTSVKINQVPPRKASFTNFPRGSNAAATQPPTCVGIAWMIARLGNSTSRMLCSDWCVRTIPSPTWLNIAVDAMSWKIASDHEHDTNIIESAEYIPSVYRWSAMFPSSHHLPCHTSHNTSFLWAWCRAVLFHLENNSIAEAWPSTIIAADVDFLKNIK